MTHNFHGNIKSPTFNTLHLMVEGQYNELALAVDLIAERIRALSSIKEVKGQPKAKEMIKHLVLGQEAIVRTARSLFPVVEKTSDEPTADLLTQRMQLHEKNAWMLRSLLEK